LPQTELPILALTLPAGREEWSGQKHHGHGVAFIWLAWKYRLAVSNFGCCHRNFADTDRLMKAEGRSVWGDVVWSSPQQMLHEENNSR
jgi:hypothetical protein